jgi:hypothetical protein
MSFIRLLPQRILAFALMLLCLVVSDKVLPVQANPPGKVGTPESAQVTVPDVVGMKAAQARSVLLRAKLKCVNGPQKELTDDRSKHDTVASQTPPAGTEVAAGTPVTLMRYVYKPKPGQKPPAGELKVENK